MLRVAHVGLDGANWQRLGASVGKAQSDTVGLLWIADFGPCTVRFDVLHIFGIDVGLGVHFTDQLTLTFRARKGNTYKN